MPSIEDIPDALLNEIFRRIDATPDRSSASLVCKHLHFIDSRQRFSLKVGCGLHPAAAALSSLCARFPNLRDLAIDYSGWTYKFGKQLDDHGLLVLSANCPALSSLTLSFCTFITDTGIAHLSRSAELCSLKLNFVPAVSSNGLLSLAFGCKRLSRLHLSRCTRVNSAGWLEHIGRAGRLEELSIKNCRAVGEGDLVRLGSGWSNLRFLEFELDANYRDSKVYSHLSACEWQKQDFPCEQLRELRLANCLTTPLRGLSCLMGQCRLLERLSLDMCIGLRDSDLVSLAGNSGNLRSISLRLPSRYLLPESVDDVPRLTDQGLRAVAYGCPFLKEVAISFPLADFPSLCCFTQSGVVALVQGCPIRVLILDHVHFFDDNGMKALCFALSLEVLELSQCQEVTDEGLQMVTQYPRLMKLKLSKCLGITDDGFKPVVKFGELESLTVEDCPQVSEEGVRGAARSVSYRQDLSWLF